MNNSRTYRKSVYSCYIFKDIDFSFDDQRFYDYLSTLYREEKAKKKSDDLYLFILSVGVFSFGDLNAYEDILDNIPNEPYPPRHLASCLNTLLPLPRSFEFNEADDIRKWIRRKSKYLRWDKVEERYYLENFRILPNDIDERTTPDGNSSSSYSDRGIIVEVFQESGMSWKAKYEPGISKLFGIFQHPNREELMVVSGGQGYIIDPETQRTIELFGGEITHVAEIIDAYRILFKSGHEFIVYGAKGLLWKQSMPIFYEIRKLGSIRNILTGECKQTVDSDWQSFWMNTDTGQTYFEDYDFVDIAVKELGISQRPWWKIW